MSNKINQIAAITTRAEKALNNYPEQQHTDWRHGMATTLENELRPLVDQENMLDVMSARAAIAAIDKLAVS